MVINNGGFGQAALCRQDRSTDGLYTAPCFALPRSTNRYKRLKCFLLSTSYLHRWPLYSPLLCFTSLYKSIQAFKVFPPKHELPAQHVPIKQSDLPVVLRQFSINIISCRSTGVATSQAKSPIFFRLLAFNPGQGPAMKFQSKHGSN